MKKVFIYIALFVTQVCYGQKIIFTNPFGGQTSNGGISSYDFATGQVTTPISLPGNPLGLVDGYRFYDNDGYYDGDTKLGDNHRRENGLFGASDGYVYGIDQFASTFYQNNVGSAVLYRFKPENPQIEVLHNFNGNTQHYSEVTVGAYKNALATPRYGIIEGTPGVLYGICLKGGAFEKGGIWKYEIAKKKFTEVASYDPSTTGYDPSGPLFKAFNNQIYGVAFRKTGSGADGHLYQVLTNTDALVYNRNLDQTAMVGFAIVTPNGPVAYNPANNTLYGARMTFDGGPGYTKGGGMYSYNFNTNTVLNINEINSSRAILGSSLVGIVRGNDGAYYGVTEFDGQTGKGALIKASDPRVGSADFVKMADFPESPSGNSMIAVADKIFGTYLEYGSTNRGIWCYNIATGMLSSQLLAGSVQGYVLPQLAVIGNTVYARTLFGGKNNAGGIIAINALSLEVTHLMDAYEPTGKSAIGELLDIGNNEFLGFSNVGGNFSDNYRNLAGTLLKYNITKKTVTSVASLPTMTKAQFDRVLNAGFDSAFQNYPFTYKPFGMHKGTNGKIYFTLNADPNPFLGSLYLSHRGHNWFFEFDPLTNQLQELAKIQDGNPHQTIEFSPGKFLIRGFDSLAVYDLTTKTLKNVQKQPIVDFHGFFQGKWLKASDGLIYGTTTLDKIVPGSQSVFYSLDPANNFNFSRIAVLNNAAQANLGLTELNGKLYGSTASGGANNHGYIFSYDLTTKLFSQIYSFLSDIDGANFSASWTANNGKLYSTSQAGGANGYGTLVEFDPATATLKVLSNLTLQNGNGIFATPIFPTYPTTADSTDIIVKDTVICANNTVALKASTLSVANPVFKWYSDSTLNTLVYTGDTYSSPALTTTTKYFIAVSGTGVNQNLSGNGRKLTVTVNPLPTTPIITADKTAICIGDSAVLTASNATGNQWYKDGLLINGAATATYKASSAGIYTVKTSSSSFCISPTSIGTVISVVPFPATPTIIADGKLKICKDENRKLSVTLPQGNTIQWFKNNSLITAAITDAIIVNETGTFTCKITNANGCGSLLSNALLVEVVCTTSIMMPDVFTPNGDGYNDKVTAIIPGLQSLRTFEIYNRIGNRVFSTTDKNKGWDGSFKGSPQPADSYIWVIEGVDSSGNKVKKTGMITLIR